MPPNNSNEAALVVAAQAGDRRALDTLIEAYLPFVYTIARRALDAEDDVDDAVQDSMLRAVRELRELRTPASFRAWLGAIAVRQVSTHLHRRRTADRHTGDLADLVGTPDAGAPFEGLTMLRLGVSQQRRQAARAAQWLDHDDRLLLSLWWLEVAGHLTRSELATAIGVSVAHAGVRVQRMRRQFDSCRALVAALDSRPRCLDLDGLVASWDGVPGATWRKRLTRHIQACDTCTPDSGMLPAAEQLLIGLALLPVPIALTTAVLGKAGLATAASATALTGAAKAGIIGHLTNVLAVHPIATLAVTGSVVAGSTLAVMTWPTAAPPPPPPVTATQYSPAAIPPSPSPRPSPSPGRAAPSPARSPARVLAVGPTSLEAGDGTGLFVTTTAALGVLTPLSSASSISARQQATFLVVAGLADAKCFSFRSPDGRYLRHASWRLRLNPNAGTELFEGDATFCVRPGSSATTVLLESSNYPGWFLHRRGSELWVDQSDGTAAFRAASSFRIRPPLAG
ncbi:sigma-70 family RNA polymerase sigma factor [Catellatospora sichuanensis]|uniref:sigma-70 family RNA polymerase sigma factor n=1 Tax=Catellatospora sichuanensis TaxID=1969805 RepID=UPI00118235EB|nr:sigma-70 family RNA polymerase sigma factor [Catellatospora sichuanensis]